MRYYVEADTHGFYYALRDSLEQAGYFEDAEPHKLIVCGDLMDRGEQAVKMQEFVLKLLEDDAIILIRGNHEDLYTDFVTKDGGRPLRHHLHNGTKDTALQLTGMDPTQAFLNPEGLAFLGRQTPFYTTIIPAMVDFFETKHYVFVHGWIPCKQGSDGSFAYLPSWRKGSAEKWRRARWINGMEAAQSISVPRKTVVCGHWHASYGHSKFEKHGPEFGAGADFSPYYGPGIIAIDACTVVSGNVNCLVVEG